MYDYTNIITAYQALIGYQQRKDPKYSIIEGTNLVNESDSINSVSPELLKTERLIDSFDNFDKFIYNDWDIATAYVFNDVVAYDGVEYKAIQPGTGNQPDITPLFWESVQAIPTISTVLQEYKDRGIRESFRDVFTSRANVDVKNLLDSSFIYESGGFRDEQGNFRTITKEGFHGLRLTSWTIPYQTIQINKVGFHFTGAETFNLYVFHSSADAPIYTEAINYTNANEWQWFDLSSVLLKYWTENKSPAGVFYVGYFAADISSDIIASDWAENAYGWCDSCPYGINSTAYFQKNSKYIEASTASFDTNELNGTNKPYGLGNYGGYAPGINLNVTVFRDPEQSIISNSNHFIQLVRMKIAILLLDGMKNNIRLNRGAEISKDHVIRELEGYANENIKGLNDMYNDKLEEVNRDLNNLDGFCDSRVLPFDTM